jgi:7,8-dihydro-6-hydroxymethylpterin-pyrophosphokinase
MKAQPRRSEQDSNRQAGRAAVHRDEGRRQLDVDVVGAGDLHRVLELVAVFQELP